MKKSQVIILGAGKPFSGEHPSALVMAPGSHRRVLDWVLDAFSRVENATFHFVGGYRLEEIIAEYPNIYFSVNPGWKTSGATSSLLSAPLASDHATYVCYSDTVFSPEIVSDIASTTADIAVCIDRQWRDRYEGRSLADLANAEKIRLKPDGRVEIGRHVAVDEADGELVGVFRFSRDAISRIRSLASSEDPHGFGRLDLPSLISLMVSRGSTIEVVENRGRWAELNAPQDLARFVLGTKAETLERLRPLVTTSRIGKQVCFTTADWRRAPDDVLTLIQDKFASCRLIVRSSAKTEDGWSASNAGGYESVLDVPAGDRAQLSQAIGRVIDSYAVGSLGDQVLVQEMLGSVTLSGVALTRTLSHGAPYYVINYDDKSSRTDSVTSGSSSPLRTVFVLKSATESVNGIDPRISAVIRSLAELEDLVGHTSLDIEFAMDREETVHILQLRPIAVRQGGAKVSDEHVVEALQEARSWFEGAGNRGGSLLDGPPVFGVMTDWNPAEIVGTKPRKLALSLYRLLITDDVWATQRAEYGYRDVRPCPLIVSFIGHPYVDVRASLNSFIPATLDEDLAERLATHYLNSLLLRPELHDKVEFDIAFTCFTFDFEDRAMERLAPHGFSAAEIDALGQALKDLTRTGIARVERDYAPLLELQRRRNAIMGRRMEPVDRAFELLDGCRRYGTLPFAHLARAGFVAISLLRSLENRGVTTAADTSAFLASLETVTRAFERDGALVHAGTMPFEVFASQYGHLRPGTYEITSMSYADDPERYLRPMVKPGQTASSPFSWAPEVKGGIESLLREADLGIDIVGFERFLRLAIQGREYAKFEFTRNLGLALDALAETEGLGPEMLSHVDITDIFKMRVGAQPSNAQAWLAARAEEGSAEYELTRSVELPPLLSTARDFECFERPVSEPNYVGLGSISAEVVTLDEGAAGSSLSLKGKIVVIPRADPGYDWLFAHHIGGLVTQYGGANSHMAIRAAELGLPAAIGVGEAIFERLASARMVILDCAIRKLEVQA